MTLHTYNVEQRSDEWYELRRGIVTASVVGKLLTPTLKVADNDTSRGVVATLVAERITGVVEPGPMAADMWRGVEHEPFAREKYAANHAEVVERGFMVLEHDNWQLGLSPDGLVGDDGGIEIKCPRAKGHILTILADAVPSYYMAQIQAALLVTGRAWWDFVSFHGGLPLFVKRVHPDERWFSAITAACIEFENRAASLLSDYSERAADLPATERIELEVIL